MKHLLQTVVLSFVLCLLSIASHAQTFTQGNLSVTYFHNPFHDTIQCVSYDSIWFRITVQNAPYGDTIKVIYLPTGEVLNAFGSNTIGPYTWTVEAQLFVFGWSKIYDIDLPAYNNDTVEFQDGPFKVLCGSDTIYSTSYDTLFWVPNPCLLDTVSGRAYFDNNSNCIYDAGDSVLQGIGVETHQQLIPPSYNPTYSVYSTDNMGHYTATIQKSWLDTAHVFLTGNLAFVFPPSACSVTAYQFTSLPQSNVDFALHCSGNIDVACWAGAPFRVRPLLPFTLSPVVNNIGCSTASGTLTLILDPRVTYSAAQSSNPATTVSGDTLRWNYANLTNVTNGGFWNSFFAGIYLTPNGSVNIGDTLCFEVSATLLPNDIDSLNNSYHVCIPVINSFDPNEKEVQPKGIGVPGYIPVSTGELTYTIHFQNTGTANALNIRVVDTLDSHIQTGTLQIIGTDHTMSPKWIRSNIVEFDFNNINLPDTASNLAASTGSVSFKVKIDTALAPGTQIKNRAAIYFDNNAPVFTNTSLNTIATPTGIIATSAATASFTLSPNPATNTVTITTGLPAGQAGDDLINSTVTVSDVIGRTAGKFEIVNPKSEINTTGLQNGMYLITLTGAGGGSGTKKLIIQK